MSTILDALRKVEGDHRARTTDARARLLFSSMLPDLHRARPRRALWFLSIGLILAGFTAGAGVALWRSDGRRENTQQAAEEPAQTSVDITGPARVIPAETSSPRSVPTTETSALALTEVPAQPLIPDVAQEIPGNEAREVQRSPFASTAPVAREAATASLSPPTSSPPVLETQNRTLDFPPTDAASLYESPDGGTTWSNTPVLDAAPADTSLSFLQWSPEPDKRIAFIKVNGGPLTLAQEGDTVGGFTVVEIRRDEVELRSGTTSFTLRAK